MSNIVFLISVIAAILIVCLILETADFLIFIDITKLLEKILEKLEGKNKI